MPATPPPRPPAPNFPQLPVSNDPVSMYNTLNSIINYLSNVQINTAHPGPVTQFTAMANNLTTVLSWNPAPNAAFYYIYKNSSTDFSQAALVTILNASKIRTLGKFSYTDPADSSVQTRYYWVLPLNEQGVAGPLSPFASVSNFFTANGGVAAGINAEAIGLDSVAIGASAVAKGTTDTVVGSGSTTTTGGNNTIVGEGNTITGDHDVAVGTANTISSSSGYAIGIGNTVTHTNSLVIGVGGGIASVSANQAMLSTDGTQPPAITGHGLMIHHSDTNYTVLGLSNNFANASNGTVFSFSCKDGVECAIGANRLGVTAYSPINFYTSGALAFAIDIGRRPVFAANNSVGANGVSFGTNCPATFTTAPYTWVDVVAADGTTCVLPIWRK